MTLIPSEHWKVKGIEGDRYKVGPLCAAPGCQRPVDHKHHLWRRSFLAGDFWWVRVPVGGGDETKVIQNVVGLCWHHHEDVTGAIGGHRAWIRWYPEPETFGWMELDNDGRWMQTGTLSLPAPIDAPSQDATPDGSPGREAERCPACGRVKHKTDHALHTPRPKRPRKSWTIKVPADEEDGALILDELTAECAEVFGHEEYQSALARYYTVTQALALVLQNRGRVEKEVDS